MDPESSKNSPDKRDEALLFLISCLKALQNNIQECSVWANNKVLQATQRQEREDAEKVHQEMQMLEENTMNCTMEVEKELVYTNSMIQTTNTVEMYNLGIKKEMHDLMLSIGVSPMDVNQALEKVQEAVKKCQEVDMEKHSVEEDLSTIKHEKASLLDQFEEDKVKQAEPLKAKREQIRLKGKVDQNDFPGNIEITIPEYKEEAQECENERCQLILQSESSEVQALIRGIPQNEKEEVILSLTSYGKALQKDLQGWSDWANKNIREATQRLAKDHAELKMLRKEKQDAEKDYQDMQTLTEMEKELAKTNSLIEGPSSSSKNWERCNAGLKKKHPLTRSTDVVAMDVNNALAKEQEAVKKCQAADMEKRSFEEDLSTLKQEKAALQKEQEKANKLVDQFEVLSKQEKKVEQGFLRQTDSLKAEREHLQLKGNLEQDKFKEKLERNKQRYKEEIEKNESEISRLSSQRIAQKTKDLAGESSSNAVKMMRECVMCMNEQISVVFLPCAHQILCEQCNVLHQTKGMGECPSCRTPITKWISVRFADPE